MCLVWPPAVFVCNAVASSKALDKSFAVKTSLKIKVTQQKSFPKMSNCPTHSKGLHIFHYDPQIVSYRFHQVSINVLFMFILFHLSKQSQDNTYLMKDRFTLLVSLFPHWSSKDTNTFVHQELKWKYPVDFFKANTHLMAEVRVVDEFTFWWSMIDNGVTARHRYSPRTGQID